ncbi:UBP-type zinc finger domain-containing protein [Flavihumibacter sp. R14]|nr:UBP-type zinc finger domain-containing protein [Flavihumibacter soli]
MNPCKHIEEISELKISNLFSCEECIKAGKTWVHLRTCQTCGKTLCCDSSPNRHMTSHYHETGHPVIISAEPGEKWFWCYADEVLWPY